MAEPLAPSDLTARLRALTPARVGLARAGTALATTPMLAFQLAHAAARDAVHAALSDGFAAEIAGRPTAAVRSRAPDRETYLRRPDLGRRLAAESRAALETCRGEVALVIADGLSASGIAEHGVALAEAIIGRLAVRSFAPVTIARQARVALGDDIGEALGASIVIVLIGERPGLSAADGIGAYITLHPRIGRIDAERNCVSNIRPGGLPLDRAADQIAALTNAAFVLGETGVRLKLTSDQLHDSDNRGRP
ncbi:ethanolamine ammonia-lyase subunit EutC [Novosphingobium album (ex Hu et al. 2023)]|uniref:Ethanolamine ammonia-lyase small subunit n=1 Tax=Novosphingobium album (ex Hu et al. 2023) TaxID=2930093 RepID=A0ABT0B003_9SPHN|nr:ethanolamine ammonia-lyase subunit EutC [Novosphingobium album (ex Hu et al. 2023)]MCJ2178402.1 ethanolamine ammonia-lyase subunit EutC [Novosphingobium album (ex Hu et al. 2023)]